MSKALLRYIRLSPTKARLIAREVQGMNAELAIASLEFTPNKAARIISKVIASAVANGGYDAQDVIITSCRVDAGPVLKRFMPRAKGRATPIRKPTAHILVEVDSKKVKKAQNPQKTTETKDNSTKDSQIKAENTESKQQKKPASKASSTKETKAKTSKPKASSQSEKTPKSKPTTAKSETTKKAAAKKKTEGEEK